MQIFFCNIFFYNSDLWRRYTLKCLCWCVQGKVGELVQPRGASEDCFEVCLVIVFVFMRFGGAKRLGDALKALFGGGNESHKKVKI